MRIRSYTLVFSTYLPVLVYGTATNNLTLEAFLDNLFDLVESALRLSLLKTFELVGFRICLKSTLLCLQCL